MRSNFKSLADKFSSTNVGDNKDFLSFYETNEDEIKNLNNFETDEELYLAVVIYHTYGRSLLYELHDFKKAEQFLNISRNLVLQYKGKFEIDLAGDVWYVQTLQHLLTVYSSTKNRYKALSVIGELKKIDGDNRPYYELEEKEIKRIRRYKTFMATAYFGMSVIAISISYRFLTETSLWYFGGIGQLLAIGGVAGAYFFKESVKSTALNRGDSLTTRS